METVEGGLARLMEAGAAVRAKSVDTRHRAFWVEPTVTFRTGFSSTPRQAPLLAKMRQFAGTLPSGMLIKAPLLVKPAKDVLVPVVVPVSLIQKPETLVPLKN